MNLIRTLVPRFRAVDGELRLRDAFEALPRADRQALRLARLNQRWQEAAATRYYGQLARRLRLPARFASLEEYAALLPPTPKSAVRDDPDAFRLRTVRGGRWLRTSGSTGTPMRAFWGQAGHLENLRDQYWSRAWWGLDPLDRQVVIWGCSYALAGGPCGLARRLAMPLVDFLRNRRRFSAYRLDAASLRACYDTLARFRPKFISAYASAAYHVALANRGRPPLAEPPQVALLSAEPIRPAYRRAISEVLGAPTAGEYGSCECGALARQSDSEAYRIFERAVLLEAVPAASGRAVLVTQLRPTGFLLLRYEVGDLVAEPIRQTADGHDALVGLLGRSHDLLRTPDGTLCHGEVIGAIIGQQMPSAAMFTVVQHCDFSLELLVEPRPGESIAPAEEAAVGERLAQVFGPAVGVRIRAVESLPPPQRGKHRFVVSELEPDKDLAATAGGRV